MKSSLLILLYFVSAPLSVLSQSANGFLPDNIEPGEHYLFYLHGGIVQQQGVNAVSQYYGAYKYLDILDSLSTRGFNVISEVMSASHFPVQPAYDVFSLPPSPPSLSLPMVFSTDFGNFPLNSEISVITTIMKKTLPLLLIMLLGLLTVTSCGLFGGEDFDESMVYGQWEWISSTGGVAGETLTPDTPGFSEKQLYFTEDHRFSIFKAGTLSVSGFYTINTTSHNASIEYEANDDTVMAVQKIEFFTPDSLLLRDYCFNCYRHTYRRMK